MQSICVHISGLEVIELAEFSTKLQKVAKPKLWFGLFQEFCDNSTNRKFRIEYDGRKIGLLYRTLLALLCEQLAEAPEQLVGL